ncbi:NAD(P)H-hydrate epimerase [Aeoliella sp. SH292]|uniref:NAD(P)H-hydrate epimerase n=1 Tax=Aeoliella sp. SH292 TaxID=3454464 RepID=UPI003F96C271
MEDRIALTRQQSREVDRIAINQYGMSGLVLMENAGRGCVDLLERRGIAGPVAILCGKGNNGGDGFVIARHLEIRGYEARVILVPRPEELTGDAAANFQILRKSGSMIIPLADEGGSAALPDALDHACQGCDWLVDCLLGTGATDDPRPPYDSIIEWMNAEPAKRLAIDVPSGLDCDTGIASATTVRANVTATFVTTKVGYANPSAQAYLGEVEVIDIGIPRKLLEEIPQ